MEILIIDYVDKLFFIFIILFFSVISVRWNNTEYKIIRQADATIQVIVTN